LITISTSPLFRGDGSIVMYLVLSWNSPRKSTKSLLMNRRYAQVLEFVLAEAQRAQRPHLLADLVHVGHQVDARIAALEAVLDVRAREVMQHHLHHRELVQVGVEK
jgi:hypothetical protein